MVTVEIKTGLPKIYFLADSLFRRDLALRSDIVRIQVREVSDCEARVLFLGKHLVGLLSAERLNVRLDQCLLLSRGALLSLAVI